MVISGAVAVAPPGAVVRLDADSSDVNVGTLGAAVAGKYPESGGEVSSGDTSG
jgi:hypothetical protein